MLRAQVIVTVAGSGLAGPLGDGGPATAAMLDAPYRVTLDNAGNLYVCDMSNGRVRKVSPAIGGTISTVAGNGTIGYSGDGGPAIYASLNGVYNMAVDLNGSLYLADGGNNRIRKVSGGIITTIAGTGTAGYNGDGIPATAATLNAPTAVAVDDTGNVYITDSKNYRIRKIDTFGVISTIAGTGVAGYSGDGGTASAAQIKRSTSLTIDKAGNFYFYDSLRIRKISTIGIVSTIAGTGISGFAGDGGPATSAQIKANDITIDTAGNVLIADGSNHRIRKIDILGVISTIGGTGEGGYFGDGGNPINAKLYGPSGITVSPFGDIFIGDVGNDRVRMFTTGMVDKVEEYEKAEYRIRVSPNPCRSNCTMNITSPASDRARVVVTDMSGVSVLCFQANTNQAVPLPTAHLPCGTYLISSSIDGQQLTAKWIIE